MAKDLRDDIKRGLEVIDKFNRNSDKMLKTLERLAVIMERNEGVVKDLVEVLERLEKNMEAVKKIIEMIGVEDEQT